MNERFVDVNDVQERVYQRYNTGIDDLNWIFGSDPRKPNAGIPQYSLTLCGGEAGVGKTRVWVNVCHCLALQKLIIVYFQLEMNIGQFKNNYFKGKSFPKGSLLLSEMKQLDEQIKLIQDVKPHIVIVDSVNKIDTGKGKKNPDLIEEAYRKVAEQTGCAVVFLAHLNQDGSVKGGTCIPHMGDIILSLTKSTEWKNCIDVQVGKTRFGQSDRSALFHHTDTGIECVTENYKVDGKDVFFKKGQITYTELKNQINSINQKRSTITLDEPQKPKMTMGSFFGLDGQGNFLQKLLK